MLRLVALGCLLIFLSTGFRRGFEQDKSAGPGEGHFGLLGISERVKRLGGDLAVNSGNGQGTTIRVQVPIDQNSSAPDLTTIETLS